MAYAQDGAFVAYDSDADLSAEAAGQYRAVKRTATGFVLCVATDAAFLGVLQDDPAAGEPGTIKTRDVSKAAAGAAIAAGAAVTTDANGRFITAAATNVVVGRALEAAAAANDLFSLQIERAGVA